MSWITVDTRLDDHPKMAALPSDTARWGWVVTLCEAKEQRKPGTFADERHYRHVMARHGKFLPNYIKAGLLDKAEDGTLQVHDWKKHQWAGTKAQQRETSNGHVVDMPGTFDGPKEDASRAVPVPVLIGTSSTEGEGVGEETETAVFAFLSEHGAFVRPDAPLGLRLYGLMRRRGAGAVLAELHEMAKVADVMSDRQWVLGLENGLEAIPSGRKTVDEALAAEATIREEAKSDRVYERMHTRRLEWFRNTGKWDEGWGPAPEGAA